jgi:hypothetical protein
MRKEKKMATWDDTTPYEDDEVKGCIFNEGELKIILEAARLALADADTFDMLVEDFGLSDEKLDSLRTKLIENTKGY